MDAQFLRDRVADYLTSRIDVVDAGDSLVVWVPFYYSDDDAVCLTVTRSQESVSVTDQGSTLLHLRARGAGTELPRFQAAWSDISRPGNRFVPDGLSIKDSDIAAWGDLNDVGRLVQMVAESAVRAEGLSYIEEPKQRVQFATSVRHQVENLIQSPPYAGRSLVRGEGRLEQRSGKTRTVTSTIQTGNSIRAAIQAVGGQKPDQREAQVARCYLVFGQSNLLKDRKISVVSGTPGGWDKANLSELEEVSTLAWLEQPDSLANAVASALA